MLLALTLLGGLWAWPIGILTLFLLSNLLVTVLVVAKPRGLVKAVEFGLEADDDTSIVSRQHLARIVQIALIRPIACWMWTDDAVGGKAYESFSRGV